MGFGERLHLLAPADKVQVMTAGSENEAQRRHW
jgi:hypothetical protein